MTAPIVVIRQVGRSALHVVLHEALELGRDCTGMLLADPQTSRRHLVLTPNDGGVTVTDLGSTNGTFVDGRRIDTPYPVVPGAVVRLGDTTIERTAEDGGSPGAGATVSSLQRELRSTSIDLVAAAVVDEHPPMPDATDHSGTVTIVFSDIEDSTRRSEELGDVAWMEVLKVHNAIMRRQVARFHGTEVKSQGDGFMLVFPSARAAVDAMVEAQRALQTWARSQPTNAVRVRVGMHTGEAIRQNHDLFGRHVNIAARVGNAARGGEVLVSSLVREIVDSRGDLRFGEPRTVLLKGLSGEWTLHPVVWQPDGVA